MAQPSVSIIIATYNRAPLLERALRSVLGEWQPGDEIIVVDDGSTDETEALVRNLGHPVRYLENGHHGPGGARNLGVRAATRDLVAFLDDDDEWIPGKLSWQRAVFEQFPEVLFVFSDFGTVRPSKDRVRHRLSTWHTDVRPWSDILGPGIPSTTIDGMPASAPPFKLHIGRLYESLILHFYVFTSTLIVRREAAGDSLLCAEDVPRLADYECFARLAHDGLAGYMDCDTAWQHRHGGRRLTDIDPATSADILVKITQRNWGADEEYLRLHRAEFEEAIDSRRLRKVRFLLSEGRRSEASDELGRFFHPPRSYRLLSHFPAGLVRSTAALLRRLRSLAQGQSLL